MGAKHLTQAERDYIISVHTTTHRSSVEIAALMGRSPASVGRVIRDYEGRLAPRPIVAPPKTPILPPRPLHGAGKGIQDDLTIYGCYFELDKPVSTMRVPASGVVTRHGVRLPEGTYTGYRSKTEHVGAWVARHFARWSGQDRAFTRPAEPKPVGWSTRVDATWVEPTDPFPRAREESWQAQRTWDEADVGVATITAVDRDEGTVTCTPGTATFFFVEQAEIWQARAEKAELELGNLRRYLMANGWDCSALLDRIQKGDVK